LCLILFFGYILAIITFFTKPERKRCRNITPIRAIL
jgi:uncharacterized membrane protein